MGAIQHACTWYAYSTLQLLGARTHKKTVPLFAMWLCAQPPSAEEQRQPFLITLRPLHGEVSNHPHPLHQRHM